VVYKTAFPALPLLAVLALGISAVPPSHSDYPPPAQQLRDGVPPEDIRCNGDRVLVIRGGGSPACVYAGTAEKMIWTPIIERDFCNVFCTL